MPEIHVELKTLEDSCLTLKPCQGALPGKGPEQLFWNLPFYLQQEYFLNLDSSRLEHLVHAQQETQACMESLQHLLVSPSFANL